MKYITIIFIIFLIFSCNERTKVDTFNPKYETIYLDIFKKPFKTPNGKVVSYKIFNDSCYFLQWGDSLNLKKFPDTLYLDGHEIRIPKFLMENKDYIVLRAGCGNPSWVGYFLPLNKSIEPKSIHEYLDFDLDNNLVAYIKECNEIEIINLKSYKTEIHKISKCSSAFPAYCIDSLSIKNRILKYKFFPETKINSTKGYLVTQKISI